MTPGKSQSGDFFSGDAYGAAWGSLGSLALSGVIAATPPLNVLFAVDDGMRQFGGDGFLPDEVAEFKDGLDETAKNTGKALIAWDTWRESMFDVTPCACSTRAGGRPTKRRAQGW
mgnify:CR=1 FL=1